MAVLVRMPLLSDTMEEGNVLTWLKKVGDTVQVGDILAQIETDKATMDLESYDEGVLLHIVVEQGKVAVDGALAVIGQQGEDYQNLLSGAIPKLENNIVQEANSEYSLSIPASLMPIRMPLLSDTMVEGKIVAWLKRVGEQVKEDDILAEVETDKATMELQAYAEGELLYQAVEVGNSVKINGLLAIVGPSGTKLDSGLIAQLSADSVKPVTKDTKQKLQEPQQALAGTALGAKQVALESNTRLKASPLAKKMARERGLDLRKIVGSGDDGRIVKRDIEAWKEERIIAQGSVGEDIIIPVNQMRSVIAKRLLQSKLESPHFYVSVSAEMSKVIEARKLLNSERKDSKISINDVVLKATALALRVHPEMNSSWRGEHIVRYANVNIAVALATEDGGLLVPVIRNTDKKSLAEISSEVKEFAQKAREKKMQPSDWADNTFTVSNLGMFGVEDFTAIINPPDAAILAVGGIIERPVVKNGQIVVGNLMRLSVSADHRAVDGALVASFLNTLKAYLEEPVRML